jgi:hypothetical protein
MKERGLNNDSIKTGEVVIYQPDAVTRLEVMVENETVWLTQAQIATVFNVGRPAITKHIRNIYACGELEENSTCSILEHMGNDGVQAYNVKYFNLDVILSVGYRVNSRNAVAFRRWASAILKEYMLRGYCFNQRLNSIEDKFDRKMADYDRRLEEHRQMIDCFIRTSLPPVEGIFFDGQIYEAYTFVADLIRSAGRRIILIDNYIDDTVLTILSKRADGVKATIYTGNISKQLQLDIDKHNAQYPLIEVRTFSKAHDRFLIIDDSVYLVGASIKDLGKKWFGFTLMENTEAEELMGRM